MNDPDGGYHIQYPDGHVSHAGRPDNCAPGFRTLFLYYATHPTVATTICYIVGDLGISVVTVGYPLPVIPVPGIWDVPPGGRVPGGWYAPLPPPGVLAGAGLPAGVLPYRPGGSHSGYSGFYWTGPAGLPSPAPLFANPAAFSAWALASIAAEIADINAFLAWLRAYLAAPKPPTGYFGTPGQVRRGGVNVARNTRWKTYYQVTIRRELRRGPWLSAALDFEEVAMALRISFGLFVASAVALAVASRAPAQGSKLEAAPSVAPAARRPAGELVRLALESEVAGNDRRRDALLREARYARPEDASVHWQLGELRIEGRWQSPREAELSASADKRLAEYSRRRDAAGASAADHAALARWCRKNRLDQQQRAEWCAVLRAEPANPEAISALKLRPFLGTLMTPAEIEQAKTEMREIVRAADNWKGEIVRWRGEAERGDARLPATVSARVAGAVRRAELVGAGAHPLAAAAAQGFPRDAAGADCRRWARTRARRRRRRWRGTQCSRLSTTCARPQSPG